MKITGILFTADMVRAESEGRKTETRRLSGLKKVNLNPDLWEWKCLVVWDPSNGHGGGLAATFIHTETYEEITLKCPYGQPGDLLYIRETWGIGKGYDGLKPTGINFKEATSIRRWWAADEPEKPEWVGKTRAAIHLPMDAARTWLKIVSITPQRLQDITEDSAKAEGLLFYQDVTGYRFKDYVADASGYGHPNHDYPTVATAGLSFFTLIQSIHGPEIVQRNPWLWAIKFERNP